MSEARDIVERLKAAEADWWGLDDEENAMLANAAWAEIERLRRERDDQLRETQRAWNERDGEKLKRIRAEREVAKLREALEPFASIGELIEVETEGFDDADELDVIFHDYLFDKVKVGAFRKAAALAQPNEGQAQ